MLDSLLVLSSPWSDERPSLASAGWPPLEEFNLRLSVRTGASCALDEAGKWSPREDFNLHYRVRSPVVCALAYEGDGRRPRNRTATDTGATRESRTPFRCVQGSYAPERWWHGDQPWDRTTFSRASAERYDHTCSLVVGWSRRRESNPRLRVTRAPCLRQHFVDVVPPAGVEPAWFRLKGGRMAALPRRVRRRNDGWL